MKWIKLGATYNIDEAYSDYKSATFWLSSDGVNVKVKLVSYWGAKEDKTKIIPVSRYGSVFDVIRIYGRI